MQVEGFMGKVVANFTMSLDGFIADANDDVNQLFKWYFSGIMRIQCREPRGILKFRRQVSKLWRSYYGAIVTGRRDFDMSKAWGGKSPLNVPIFIVTHHPPSEWVNTESPFTFVTEGVASAIEQAQQVAGNKMIAVGGSQIAQQAIQAGLLDEIHPYFAQ
jgi:dihydrofolate reductase